MLSLNLKSQQELSLHIPHIGYTQIVLILTVFKLKIKACYHQWEWVEPGSGGKLSDFEVKTTLQICDPRLV